MKIDIGFEVDGRRVNADQLEKALTGKVQETVRATLMDAVRNVTCAEHGKRATVTRMDLPEFELSCCCEALRDEIVRRVGA